MNKLKYSMLWILLSYNSKIFASDAWILWWVSTEDLRKWDIHLDDIPWILSFAIDFLMWFAWTIAVIFIIIWAYQLAFWTLTENNKTKWKETIIMALSWFALASLSWIIIKLIIDNFT